MAFVKKNFVWGIFISILTIFAMSHNVNAVTPVIDLTNYTVVRAGTFSNTCTFDGTYTQTDCTVQIQGTTRLRQIETVNSYAMKTGDLVTFYLFAYSNSNGFEYEPQLLNFTYSTQGFSLLNYSEISYSQYAEKMYSTNGYINWAPNNDLNIDFYNTYAFYKIYEVTLRSDNDTTKPFGLYGGNQGLFYLNGSDYGLKVTFAIKNIVQWRATESKENKEVEEKTQEAVDESQSAGSSSSSSASQGGANLLTAITGFFNVITSAQPSNCRFNAPLNTYFGNERLNVDLCALDLPSGIGALTSIIAIGILIPFAIHMFNKFIALFRSFQS